MELAAGTVPCPSCGQSGPADARFCPGCGRVLSGVVYAGFWMRFLAVFIDGLILFIPNVILAAIASGDLAVALILQIGLNLAYVVGFWSAKGATPGKMIVGVEITKANGEEIGFGTALLRYVGYFLSGIILGIGHLMIAFTGQKRGLHDYIADTIVVKTR